MTKKKKVRFRKVLFVYLTPEEYEKLTVTAKQTSCGSLSQYGRKVLFGKPITMLYRNRSADDAVEAGIQILNSMKILARHVSFSEEEKAWIKKEITVLEELITKIFDLCLQKQNVIRAWACPSATAR